MEVNEVHGKLFPTKPYDFFKSLNFTNMFAPTEEEQTIFNFKLTKSLYLEEQTIAFRLESKGTVENPVLAYTLYSYDKIGQKIKSELLDRINFFLSLDDDLKPFYDRVKDDNSFKPVLNKLYGLHQVKFLTPFEAAAWAVLGQRISMKVAHQMKERLTRAVGDNITVDGVDYRTFPSPDQIIKLGNEKLFSILRNKRKSEYLMTVSESFKDVDENFLRNAPVADVKEWLLKIRGIGEWSAHLELIRGLGRMDELSSNDRMLMNCARKYYGSQTTEQELKLIAEKYENFKGYWAYYLRTVC